MVARVPSPHWCEMSNSSPVQCFKGVSKKKLDFWLDSNNFMYKITSFIGKTTFIPFQGTKSDSFQTPFLTIFWKPIKIRGLCTKILNFKSKYLKMSQKVAKSFNFWWNISSESLWKSQYFAYPCLSRLNFIKTHQCGLLASQLTDSWILKRPFQNHNKASFSKSRFSIITAVSHKFSYSTYIHF